MTIKTNFEFKQGDYVELAGMSEEQVEAVKEEMLKQSTGGWWNGSVNYSEAAGLVIDEEDCDVWFTNSLKTDNDRYLTIQDIFPEDPLEEMSRLDQEMGIYDTDMENTKTPLEESYKCCEGGDMSAGCYHDNCTGANKVFNLQEVRTWRCFQQVAEVIGDEDAEWELGKVLMQINEQGFGEWDSEEDLEVNFLGEAFEWEWAVQGFNFWSTIHQGIKPEGYDTTPDTPPTPEVDKKPELIIPDDAKGSSEEPPKQSKTVGELIEDIAYKLPQSSLEITIKANGSAYLHGEGLPVVDITKLEVETVDKLLDVLVECAGCFVEFNEQGD